jgi:hypothetical protein
VLLIECLLRYWLSLETFGYTLLLYASLISPMRATCPTHLIRHCSRLCCFSTSVYCCLLRYRLSPETFGYTIVLYAFLISPMRATCPTISSVTVRICVASQPVFIVVYFVIDSVQKLLDTLSYCMHFSSPPCVLRALPILSVTVHIGTDLMVLEKVGNRGGGVVSRGSIVMWTSWVECRAIKKPRVPRCVSQFTAVNLTDVCN